MSFITAKAVNNSSNNYNIQHTVLLQALDNTLFIVISKPALNNNYSIVGFFSSTY